MNLEGLMSHDLANILLSGPNVPVVSGDINGFFEPVIKAGGTSKFHIHYHSGGKELCFYGAEYCKCEPNLEEFDVSCLEVSIE